MALKLTWYVPTDVAPASPSTVSTDHSTGTTLRESEVTPSMQLSTETTPSRTRARQYKTALARNLSFILHDSPELQQFDKLRYSLKNNQHGGYNTLSKLFEQRTLQQYAHKRLLVHEWGHQLS